MKARRFRQFNQVYPSAMFRSVIIRDRHFSAFAISSANAAATNGIHMPMIKTGDLIVKQDKDGWAAIKILAVDAWPDGTSSAHCLVYMPVFNKPTVDALQGAAVQGWHVPINAASFSEGWEHIGNEAATESELIGFVEYLKLTDFPRYIAFTGQDAKQIVRRANEHYKRACALGDQGMATEAIAEYTRAVDLFPLFHEAIDNRAFTYMDLGRIREALADFEQSLHINPDGMAAFFSRGECLMKLGDLKAAEAIFREGQSRFPEQRSMFEKFLGHVQTLQKNG